VGLSGEAQKGQMLMETEEKLEAAILQLQLREAEMDSVAQHFDNVNQQIHDRDMELHNLRGQVAQLQQNLSESFNENHTLKETVNQQKVAIMSLQTAVEERRKSESRHKTVRLIYKDSSDVSGDESVGEKQRYTINNNNNHLTPRSFLMSSSDSFEI